jgi:hypothetical protein
MTDQLELNLETVPAPLPEILTLREFAEQMAEQYGDARLLRLLQARED